MNDAYLIPLFISGSLLLVLFVFFIGGYLLVQKQKQNKYQAEKAKMIFDHQNKMLTARVEEQERTMDQMSKEIHDNIGQMLTFTKMSLFSIARYATDTKQVQIIDRTKELVDQLIKDVHSISHNLNSDFIKNRGLVYALQDELDIINFAQKAVCDMQVIGEQRTFEPEQALLIYRIAQEAIHNIAKHANAATLKIILTYSPAEFTMSIADDGVGFEKEKIYALKGIGFQNMLHRAKLLEGVIDIHSEPGQGSSIILRVSSDEDTIPGVNQAFL